ncbi:hypothetical protein V2J09_022857 [Rumex salicifolius]
MEGVIHCDGEQVRAQPMEGLHEMGPPPFLTKTFEMVEDPATDPIVSWSRAKNSFIVWDSHRFSAILLPKYFKHGQKTKDDVSCGFKKIDPDRWEFANEGFLGGQKHLLKTIKRRRNVSQYVQQKGDPCLELGHFGLDGEVERLTRDCSLLTAEVVKLRQQQQNSREQVMALQARLQAIERKQQQMMVFLAKALANPLFVQSLMHQRKELRGIELGRKRRLTASSIEENMKEEVLTAAMDVSAIEPNIETLFSAALDNDMTSEITDSKVVPVSLTNSMDVGDVDDDINWEKLLHEDFIDEAEDEVPALGVDLSDVDLISNWKD